MCLDHESPHPRLSLASSAVLGFASSHWAMASLLRAGVKTHFGITFRCRAAVLTTGTFMNGRIWVGRASMPAGR